jgi:hypothetical protein
LLIARLVAAAAISHCASFVFPDDLEGLVMRIPVAALCAALLYAAPASAYIFSDTFDPHGVQGSVWRPWTTGGIDNLVTTDNSHNITPGGSLSARVHASDPAAWNGWADFGAQNGPIRADVYVFEDRNEPGRDPSRPVAIMLALFGDAPLPNNFSDYLQLGVVDFFPGGSQTYGYRTRYNDATGGGIINTGVSRKAGWTKLSIEADDYASGGAVRFYIDDVFVGGSFRAGANSGAGGLSQVPLRYIRIGNNRKSYENIWYDDVRVFVPEPTSLVVLGIGAISLVGFARPRRPLRNAA